MQVTFSSSALRNFSALNRLFSLISKLFRKFYQLIAFCYETLKHQQKLAEYAPCLPVLSESDASIVQSLHEEGVYTIPLDELGFELNVELLEAANQIVAIMPDRPGHSGIDAHAKTADLLEQSALFHWGLQERLLNIAEAYLGLPPVFNDIHCRRDFANGVQAGSRMWHVDSYDHRILRVFVYLSDVSESTGAFQYVSRRSRRWLIPILEQFGTVPDWVINLLIPTEQIKSCTGTRGTVVFAGTGSILHRGRVPITGERLTLVFNFNTREVKKAEEAKTIVTAEELSSIAQTCTPRQQQALLWM